MKNAFTLMALLVLPAELAAEPLTFEAALRKAEADAPSLKGRAATVQAAQSAAISAGRLPDPTLDVGIRDFPVTGPDAGRFNRDDFTMTTIGVSQQFVNPAKRRARAARAGAEIGIAEAGVEVEARNIRLETALAWIGPKILCLAGQVQDTGLSALDAMLDDAALCCGFSPRQHPLRPHITLARKAPATLPLSLAPLAWYADTLHLYHSERTEAGLYYRPIASWPLT